MEVVMAINSQLSNSQRNSSNARLPNKAKRNAQLKRQLVNKATAMRISSNHKDLSARHRPLDTVVLHRVSSNLNALQLALQHMPVVAVVASMTKFHLLVCTTWPVVKH